MTISRCSELLAMLVKKPLWMIGRRKARLGRVSFCKIQKTRLEFTRDSVNVRLMDGRIYVLNVEAVTKCVGFRYR